MASQIPSVPYFKSQNRICNSFQRVYNSELLLLENELNTGQITQKMYDDCVAAIERDQRHLTILRDSLIEFRQKETATSEIYRS